MRKICLVAAFLVATISSFNSTALGAPSKAAAPAKAARSFSGDRFNLRISPLMLLVGGIAADLDYAVSSDWTVGPTVSYWHTKMKSSATFTSDYDVTAMAFGVRANWFMNGVYTDGLYVAPSLRYSSATVSTTDQFGSVTASAAIPLAACLVGYGWFWDSFNIMLGAGASLGLGSTTVTVKDSTGTSTEVSSPSAGFALEWTLGWTF